MAHVLGMIRRMLFLQQIDVGSVTAIEWIMSLGFVDISKAYRCSTLFGDIGLLALISG